MRLEPWQGLVIGLLLLICVSLSLLAGFLYRRVAQSPDGDRPKKATPAAAERTVSAPFPDPAPHLASWFDRTASVEAELKGLTRRMTDLEEAAEARHKKIMGAVHGAKGGRPKSSEEEEEADTRLTPDLWAQLEAMQPKPAAAPAAPAPRTNGLPPLVRRRDL